MDQQVTNHAVAQNRTAVGAKVRPGVGRHAHVQRAAAPSCSRRGVRLSFSSAGGCRSQPPVSLVSCDMDVRTGGKYRLEFGTGGSETMAFYGKYLEVVSDERIVWTNDEGEEGAVTTVTFEDQAGRRC